MRHAKITRALYCATPLCQLFAYAQMIRVNRDQQLGKNGRFHLGFLSRGGGKRDNSRVRGGGQRLLYVFPSIKNDVVLINFIILEGVWGYAPPGNFFKVSTSETASEHSDRESLSVISTGSPLFQVKCCKVVGYVSYRA